VPELIVAALSPQGMVIAAALRYTL